MNIGAIQGKNLKNWKSCISAVRYTNVNVIVYQQQSWTIPFRTEFKLIKLFFQSFHKTSCCYDAKKRSWNKGHFRIYIIIAQPMPWKRFLQCTLFYSTLSHSKQVAGGTVFRKHTVLVIFWYMPQFFYCVVHPGSLSPNAEKINLFFYFIHNFLVYLHRLKSLELCL